MRLVPRCSGGCQHVLGNAHTRPAPESRAATGGAGRCAPGGPMDMCTMRWRAPAPVRGQRIRVAHRRSPSHTCPQAATTIDNPNPRPQYTGTIYNGSTRFASPIPGRPRLIPELEMTARRRAVEPARSNAAPMHLPSRKRRTLWYLASALGLETGNCESARATQQQRWRLRHVMGARRARNPDAIGVGRRSLSALGTAASDPRVLDSSSRRHLSGISDEGQPVGEDASVR